MPASIPHLMPLTGIRVLDLSRAVSGPYVGRILADLGADVIKVLSPEGDISEEFGRMQAGHSGLFAQMNAGKRTVELDWRQDSDREATRALAAEADIVVENYRAGALDNLGLGWDALSAINPRLIMVSITGFGTDSVESGRRAYAPVMHAESGLIMRHARLNNDVASDLPLALADTLAALHGAIATTAALRLRDLTGVGEHIDLSMIEAVISSDDHIHHALEGNPRPMESRGLIWDAPGGPLMLAVDLGATWKFLSRRAGVTDPGDPSAPLSEKSERRTRIIQDWILSHPDRSAVIQAVEAAGITWADVRAPEDILKQPTFAARPPFDEIGDGEGGTRRVVRLPYRFRNAGPARPGNVHPATDAASLIEAWRSHGN